jgi:hypothetical protein
MKQNNTSRILALIAAAVLLSGCAEPTGKIISDAVRQSDQRAVQRENVLLAEHMALIDKLRAEGDPMGEYLWVRANDDQFIPNPIKDRPTIKKMYEAAAAKGSIDAAHKAALMSFFDGASLGGSYARISEAERAQKALVWRQALVELEAATAQQCYHWGIVLDGMANRRCLRPVVTAGKVWPKFRDGAAYPKDKSLQSTWSAKDDVCLAFLDKQPPQFFFNRKFPACR